jgi:hypothetical protein
MSQRIALTHLTLVLALLLGACASVPVLSGPTPTVTVVPIRPSASAATAVPGQVEVPGCGPNDLVDALRPLVPFSESSLSENSLDGVRNLNIWFVDPALDPLAAGGAIAENTALARLHATRMAHLLNRASECVAAVFAGITTIAVDRDYNVWFSGQIVPASLPQAANPSDGDLGPAVQAFTVGYSRTGETSSGIRPGAETGACLWPEARERLLSHFAEGRQNLAFYMSIDDDGVNVWAQWDGPADFDVLQADLLGLRPELACLYPGLDTFWIVYLDSTGTTQLVLAAAGDVVRDSSDEDFINQLEIIYPAVQAGQGARPREGRLSSTTAARTSAPPAT